MQLDRYKLLKEEAFRQPIVDRIADSSHSAQRVHVIPVANHMLMCIEGNMGLLADSTLLGSVAHATAAAPPQHCCCRHCMFWPTALSAPGCSEDLHAAPQAPSVCDHWRRWLVGSHGSPAHSRGVKSAVITGSDIDGLLTVMGLLHTAAQ